ncbi:MAG: 16S rRNA (cytidine(1402)-2'-O)-methyltransferase [Corynebacteriales bacterium]|nr:16S rRNA (cytidine(1402)-2'-O)-methyltransferase [Mycobacteriales bacterium]
MATSGGTLILAATPLGNIDDASSHLREVLATAQVIAAEDTRRLRRLARDLDISISGRIISFYDANEQARVPELLEALHSGDTVVVATDAGMPSVSDPGYRLVNAAIEAGIGITCAPGPSAVTTALALSGLPCDRFCFEGFLPRKPGERRRALEELVAEKRTQVFFEAPHRAEASLTAMAEVFGAERRAAVCRELTKTYEEIKRGTLAELAQWARDGVRGELTIVVAGAATAHIEVTPDALAEEVAVLADSGLTRKEAMQEVARAHGMTRRAVYDAVLAAKKE